MVGAARLEEKRKGENGKRSSRDGSDREDGPVVLGLLLTV